MNECVCDFYLYVSYFKFKRQWLTGWNITCLAQFFVFILIYFIYSSSQGWFPAAYVVPMEDFSNTIATR